MIRIKSNNTFIGGGVFSAIAASLCCIMPVIALLAGTSSIAASFSWIEPARPFLICISILVLLLAWYQKLKPSKTIDIDCNCETSKTSFMQSKTFLAIITVFAILMMSFPLYAKMFSKPKFQAIITATADNIQEVKFNMQGMSCEGCELEVNNELSKVPGVLAYKTSYPAKSSMVTFDKSKVDIPTITNAITRTGYKVINYEPMNKKK